MQPDYPFDDLPAPGTTLEIVAGVRWVRMPLPLALDHVNLWLLSDGAAWAAVDTGLATEAIRDAWRALLPRHPLSRLIVTHFHPDHLGLAAWLQQETGAPLSMSLGDYQFARLVHAELPGYAVADMVAFFRRHGLAETMLSALERRGNAYRRGVPEIPAAFHRLRDGDRLDIGGRDWLVIAGYGHAPEHCSLYCDALGILISGDMLLPKISTNVPVLSQTPADDPLADFLASLGRLAELPADTLVLPSHGKPFRGIAARVAALRRHHEERCAAVLAALDEARSVAELVPVVFERPITDPHQSMFAMGEAMAHVNYLEHRRRVRRHEESGVVRFVKSS